MLFLACYRAPAAYRSSGGENPFPVATAAETKTEATPVEVTAKEKVSVGKRLAPIRGGLSFVYSFLRAFPYFVWMSIKEMVGPLVGRSASNSKQKTSVSDAPVVKKASNSTVEEIRASVRKEIGEQVETKPAPEAVVDTSENTSEKVENEKLDEPEIAPLISEVVAEPDPEPVEPETPEVLETSEVPEMVKTPVEPKAQTAKAAPNGDDLKRIKGIGAVLEKELNALGINSYEQIANLTVEDLAEARMKLTIMQRAKKDDWLEQATLLAAGESTEFSERVEVSKVSSSSNDTDDKGER